MKCAVDDIKQQFTAPVPTELLRQTACRAEADDQFPFDHRVGSIVSKTDHVGRIVVVQMSTVDRVNRIVVSDHHADPAAGKSPRRGSRIDRIFNRGFKLRVPVGIGCRWQVDRDRNFDGVQTWSTQRGSGQFGDRIMPTVAPDI